MYEEDHSLYGYLSRRSDTELLVVLGKVKLEKQTEYTRSIMEMLTEILTARGIDTNIDLSLVIRGGKEKIYCSFVEETQEE